MKPGLLPIISITLLASSCSDPQPSAEVKSWSVSAKGEGAYLFAAEGQFEDSKTGVFHKQVETVDAKGCHSLHYVEDEYLLAGQPPNAFKIRMPLQSKSRLANARFFIKFWDIKQGTGEEGSLIFDEQKVIDPSVKPPSLPSQPCNASNEKLKEQAKTDPEGADAESIDAMSRNEVVATAINTAGFLCARVTDMYPQGGNIIVHCVEYRNGSGRVKYQIDSGSMTVTPF